MVREIICRVMKNSHEPIYIGWTRPLAYHAPEKTAAFGAATGLENLNERPRPTCNSVGCHLKSLGGGSKFVVAGGAFRELLSSFAMPNRI